MAKQVVRITENELKRIVNESVKKVLKESFEGLFEVYTYTKGFPIFVRYGETIYQVPGEMEYMLKDLDTREGRMSFLSAINNGEMPISKLDALTLKERGYRGRAFNANAF